MIEKRRKTAPIASPISADTPAEQEAVPQGPQISAILIVYNQAEALRRAIEALEKSNDREKLEILVVDCASTDGSANLDTDFPAVNILRLPHHLGAAKALNIATRTSKADLLFFLSPDVEVSPGTVQRLATRLEEDPEAAAAGPLLTDPNGKPLQTVHPMPAREDLAAACKGEKLPSIATQTGQDAQNVDYPGLEALMVRKNFVRGMNFFDERNFGHYWADADLAAQVRRAGKKIRIYPQITAVYRPSPDPLEGETLAQVDKITGAAALLNKYGGGGFSFKLGAALGALGRLDIGKFTKILSGTKLDGSQAG
jgi:GT2 family glycosyltransferase